MIIVTVAGLVVLDKLRMDFIANVEELVFEVVVVRMSQCFVCLSVGLCVSWVG